jgi:hypothetical protein
MLSVSASLGRSYSIVLGWFWFKCWHGTDTSQWNAPHILSAWVFRLFSEEREHRAITDKRYSETHSKCVIHFSSHICIYHDLVWSDALMRIDKR